MRDDLIAAVARATLYPYNKAKYAKYQATLADAPRLERHLLMQLIREHQDTGYGRDHNFSAIKSVEAFRGQVPIIDYDHVAPYIDAVAHGDVNALFPRNEPVLEFSCTSGTTGPPKVLPVTRRWLRTYQHHWRIWGIKALMDHPAIMHKKWLQISGSARIGQTPSGHRVGMISAITARYQNPIMKFGFAAPHEVGDIADGPTRNYTILRLAIAHQVGFIITITAANLIRLAELADHSKEALIKDLFDGTLTGSGVGELPLGRLQAMVRTRHPERARELERIVKATGTLYPKDFWPLEQVACWTGGTVGYQARNLPKYYGATPVRDVGYLSTEGRHTIPIDDFSPNGILVAGGAFYEFEPHSGGEPINGHDLVVGESYAVIVTTAQGLYRYRMGDIVRCNGFAASSPILEFICKTAQFSDMEGEKISGHQIVQAMMMCATRLGFNIECFSAIPIRPALGAPYYAYVIETCDSNGDRDSAMAAMLDTDLSAQNFVYKYKREEGTLGPVRLLIVVSGSFAAWAHEHGSRAGTGETQYKQPALLDAAMLPQLQIVRMVESNPAARKNFETAV